MGDRFHAWVVIFLHGRSFSLHGPSFSCVGNRLVRGPSFWCVGDRFGAWAVIFMHGRLVSCMGDRAWAVGLMQRWLLALVGSLLRVGLLSCGSAGTIVEGWVVLTMFVVRLPRHRQ